MKRVFRLAPLVVALVALATAGLMAAATPALAQPKPKVRTYTVQPGDSVWSIAEEFYGSGDKYKLIYKYNDFIGPPPFLLKPGQVLTLPEGSISPEAQVEWMRRDVKAKPPRAFDWLSASQKMNLWKLYQVSTGDESAVHIVFEDASDLRLSDNALLVIYGGTSKQAQSKEKQKTQVLLKEGTVRGGLAALDGPTASAPMVIETSSGTIELKSKLAQVQADSLSAIVSVFDGQAEVKSQGASVTVPKGQGTVVPKGKPPEKPTPLPPPPDWNVGDGSAVAVVPPGGRATFEAAWRKVAEAKKYRVELAQDEAFKQTLVNVLVPAETTRFTLEKIPVGRFWARISARDGRGLEGMPTKPLPIDVVGLVSSRKMTQDESGRWEVTGFSRLELGGASVSEPGAGPTRAAGPAEGVEWSLDDGAFMPGAEPTRVQGYGKHVVRVRRVGESIVSSFDFQVLSVSATLELAPETTPATPTPETTTPATPTPATPEATTPATPTPATPAPTPPPTSVSAPASKAEVIAGGAPRVIILTLVDERGRPAAVPDAVLEAEPGGPLTLESVGPGRFAATLPAPTPPGPTRIELRASWPPGPLATLTLPVRQLLPDEPYRYQWAESIGTAVTDGPTAPTPLPNTVPIDRLGVQTALFSRADETYAVVALGAEVGLVDQRLGLDGAVTLFRPPLSTDRSQTNELGDAILGVRYLAHQNARLVLAPSFRVRLGLGDPDPAMDAGASRIGWEPSLLLRYRIARDLWFDTRQGVYSADSDTAYIGDYALLYRVTERVSADLRVMSAIVMFDGGDPVSLGVAAGARLHLGRARLGLDLNVGFGHGGQRRYGDFGLALTLDIGLGTP